MSPQNYKLLVCGMQRMLFSFSWLIRCCCGCCRSFSTLAPPVHTPLHARIALHLLRRLGRDFLLRRPGPELQSSRAPSLSAHEELDAREADRDGGGGINAHQTLTKR